MTTRTAIALLCGGAAGWLQQGCAARVALAHPEMRPLTALAATAPLGDHFQRDRAGGVSEEGLRAILEAPVELDERQRLGVLPVSDSYRPDRGVPIPAVPAELTRTIEAAGVFQAATEVSTDWPADGDVPGLREIAARYRSGYLLLYRHRFVDDSYVNAWGWLYLTLVGGMLAPSQTLETAGILEATLFDVRSGTILFTVYERVSAHSDETPWNEARKLRVMKTRLLEQAAEKLAAQVVSKLRRLVGANRATAG